MKLWLVFLMAVIVFLVLSAIVALIDEHFEGDDDDDLYLR